MVRLAFFFKSRKSAILINLTYLTSQTNRQIWQISLCNSILVPSDASLFKRTCCHSISFTLTVFLQFVGMNLAQIDQPCLNLVNSDSFTGAATFPSKTPCTFRSTVQRRMFVYILNDATCSTGPLAPAHLAPIWRSTDATTDVPLPKIISTEGLNPLVMASRDGVFEDRQSLIDPPTK